MAGLGEAGWAAGQRLIASAGPGAVRFWDGIPLPAVLARRTELESQGAEVAVGGDARELIEREPCPRCVVKSPGIAPSAPPLAIARERGIPVIDEAELGWRLDSRPLVAITGTNGKSTTAALACAVLRGGGYDPVLAGNTHFGPPLSALGDHRGDVVVGEISSFQLESCPRLLPEIAVLTNLTSHHLDRHGSIERYGACKRRLFVRPEGHAPVAIVNVSDDFGRALADELRTRGGRVLAYGLGEEADYRIEDCHWTLASGSVSVRTPQGRVTLETQLPGRHNAMNAVAALALAGALELDLDAAAAAIEAASPVPGRLESVSEQSDFDVIVDYAHNADGIRCTLETLRSVIASRPGAKLRVVASALWFFKREERAAIGAAARSLSDHLLLTTERWRPDESATSLPAGLAEGAQAAEGGALELVPDRAEAIERALRAAEPGDLVAILGRGATAAPLFEASGRARPFDDRVEARRVLEELAGAEDRRGSAAPRSPDA